MEEEVAEGKFIQLLYKGALTLENILELHKRSSRTEVSQSMLEEVAKKLEVFIVIQNNNPEHRRVN